MTKKAILDINVFISALFWKEAPHQVLKEMLEGEFLNFISPQILEELQDKISNKFRVPSERAKEFLEIVAFVSRLNYPTKKIDAVKKDSSDNKIIECAIEANASFIISGDKHLLEIGEYKGIKMLSPREFLSMLKQ